MLPSVLKSWRVPTLQIPIKACKDGLQIMSKDGILGQIQRYIASDVEAIPQSRAVSVRPSSDMTLKGPEFVYFWEKLKKCFGFGSKKADKKKSKLSKKKQTCKPGKVSKSTKGKKKDDCLKTPSSEVCKKSDKPKADCLSKGDQKVSQTAVRKADPSKQKDEKKDDPSKKKGDQKKEDPCKKKDEKKADPCKTNAEVIGKKKDDPCRKKDEKKDDPCKKKDEKKVDPCGKKDEKKPDPCAKKYEKKEDPCKKKEVNNKEDPCKKKEDPCKRREEKKNDPCKPKEEKVKEDPCKKKEEKKKEDPCKKKDEKKEDPCKKKDEKKEDPCKRKEEKKNDPCKPKEEKVKQDPCKKKEEKKKEDPCKKKDEKKKDPCEKINHPKKEDPCKKKDESKKEDPCKKKQEKKKDDPCKKKDKPKKEDPCKKVEEKKKNDPCKKTEESMKKNNPCQKTDQKKDDPCKKKAEKKDPCGDRFVPNISMAMEPILIFSASQPVQKKEEEMRNSCRDPCAQEVCGVLPGQDEPCGSSVSWKMKVNPCRQGRASSSKSKRTDSTDCIVRSEKKDECATQERKKEVECGITANPCGKKQCPNKCKVENNRKLSTSDLELGVINVTNIQTGQTGDILEMGVNFATRKISPSRPSTRELRESGSAAAPGVGQKVTGLIGKIKGIWNGPQEGNLPKPITESRSSRGTTNGPGRTPARYPTTQRCGSLDTLHMDGIAKDVPELSKGHGFLLATFDPPKDDFEKCEDRVPPCPESEEPPCPKQIEPCNEDRDSVWSDIDESYGYEKFPFKKEQTHGVPMEIASLSSKDPYANHKL